MNKPKFYQAVLQPLNEEEVSKITKGQTIAKRMGTEEARCPLCGHNEWWLLPQLSAAVKEGGKAYCECLSCGYQTHL
jgi:DNA-directed RNA polymerase subunit M/transcription elongation factor TFIIS